jgi:hypothetical protein
MPFEAIGDAQSLASSTIENLATMTALAATIGITLAAIKNVDLIPPVGLLVAGAIAINPHIEMPELPDFINPLDDITSPALSINIDACHMDLSIFGTLLKALMEALAMVIKSAINAIVKALYDAVLMFEYICKTCAAVKNWFLEVCRLIGEAMGKTYNDLFNKKKEFEEKALNGTDPMDKTKQKLYERALQWIEGVLNKIGINRKNLMAAVDEFLYMLEVISRTFYTGIEKLMVSLGKISEDWDCLTKVATYVMK